MNMQTLGYFLLTLNCKLIKLVLMTPLIKWSQKWWGWWWYQYV